MSTNIPNPNKTTKDMNPYPLTGGILRSWLTQVMAEALQEEQQRREQRTNPEINDVRELVQQLFPFANSVTVVNRTKPSEETEAACCKCGDPNCEINSGIAEEEEESVCPECGSAECLQVQQEADSILKQDQEKKSDIFGQPVKDTNSLENVTNVTFIPGQSTEDTRVLVGGTEVRGVIRAVLDYESDLTFPILRLEIINPTVDRTTVL